MDQYHDVGTSGEMPEEMRVLRISAEAFQGYEENTSILETQIEKAATFADSFATMAEIFERAEAEYRNMHSTASFLAYEETEEEAFYQEEIAESVESFEVYEQQLEGELDTLLDETGADQYDDAIQKATITLAGIQMSTIPNGIHREYDVDPDPEAIADLRAYSHADLRSNPTRDPMGLFVESVHIDEETLALELTEVNAYGLVESMQEGESLLDAFVERDQTHADRDEVSIAGMEGRYIRAVTRAQERGSSVKQELINLATGHKDSDGRTFD